MHGVKPCFSVFLLLSVVPSAMCSTCDVLGTLTCSGACACTSSSQITAGVITDGPGQYANNLDCAWVIGSNALISLQFSEFETQGPLDFVSVNRCMTPTCDNPVVLLDRAAGTVSAGSIVYTTIYNNLLPAYPYLRVIFKSDATTRKEGFVANWRTTPIFDPACVPILCGVGTYRDGDVCRECQANSTSPGCSACDVLGTLTCSGACACTSSSQITAGVITDGPGLYANDMDCSWLIGSNALISLRFTEFQTQGGQDFVSVNRCMTPTCDNPVVLLNRAYGDISADSTLYTTMHNNLLPDYPYLQVIFLSSASVIDEGFVANWRITPIFDQYCVPILCGVGTYRDVDVCRECHANSTSPANSTDVSACFCKEGFVANWHTPHDVHPDCVFQPNCGVGEYSHGQVCVQCQANSISPANSTDVTACVCDAGFSGFIPGTCILCRVGKFAALPK